MISYEKAKSIAIASRVPDGKICCAGDAGIFYIFLVVPKDFPTDIDGAEFGITFTAVDKDDGHVFDYRITGPLPEGVDRIKKIE